MGPVALSQTSLCCETSGTRLVHHVMSLFMPQLLLVAAAFTDPPLVIWTHGRELLAQSRYAAVP